MKFTNDWFEQSSRLIWEELLKVIKPKTILEVGSYEGASICYLIEKLGNDSDLEIHAIDTWQGGTDHISKKLSSEISMKSVEERFCLNTKESIEKVSKKIDFNVHRGPSDLELCSLLCLGRKGYFDFVYIDGSHKTSDVLSDCVLGFNLLKKGGLMILDDYLWCVDGGVTYRPKVAIDAFINLNYDDLAVIQITNYQVYLFKKKDEAQS